MTRAKLWALWRWCLRNARLISLALFLTACPVFAQDTFTDNALVRVATWLIKLMIYGFGGFFLVAGGVQAARMKVFGTGNYQNESPWSKILWGGAILLTPAIFDLAKDVIVEAAGPDAALDELYDPFGQ